MSTATEQPQWHVLDFFYDNLDDCALTILVNGICFHIQADSTKLDSNTEAGAEYHNILRDLQNSNAEITDSQHGNNDVDSDSGVDVKESQEDLDQTENKPSPTYDAEATLKTWMVTPLIDSFNELAPPDNTAQAKTVHDWYQFSTHFCELAVSENGKEIQAIELDETSMLLQRIQKLIPSAIMPKYISDKLNVPIYNASELLVLESNDQPVGTPYHPCKVRHVKGKETLFLKIIDNSQPKATKREIDILRRIKDLALHEEFHVPLLKGLVVLDDAEDTASGKGRFMGFLQSDIPDPTPLTLLLHDEISQKKRRAWAAEVNRIKDLLHEHNIIWGDAKADNFVVDSKDRLWIIDFGGGYTEGWVEPQFHETRKGDDMGIQKVINALEDPTENVHAHSEERRFEENSKTVNGRSKKRRRDDTVPDRECEEPKAKSRKSR